MVFCYLKQYVNNGDLKLCTYCFDSTATGKQDLQLCLNLNPVAGDKFIHLEFGIDGISKVDCITPDNGAVTALATDAFPYRAFRTNDQQGYYWCGELTIPAQFVAEHFSTRLEEKSIILLNFYKIFADNEDYASLFPDSQNSIQHKHTTMEEFIVLNY